MGGENGDLWVKIRVKTKDLCLDVTPKTLSVVDENPNFLTKNPQILQNFFIFFFNSSY